MKSKGQTSSKKGLSQHHGGQPDPEKCDPTPVEIPTGKGMPPTMAEQIAEAVHAQLEAREGAQYETPEEADDFEEDQPEVLQMSPYEQYFQEVVEMEPDLEPEPEPEPEQEVVEPSE